MLHLTYGSRRSQYLTDGEHCLWYIQCGTIHSQREWEQGQAGFDQETSPALHPKSRMRGDGNVFRRESIFPSHRLVSSSCMQLNGAKGRGLYFIQMYGRKGAEFQKQREREIQFPPPQALLQKQNAIPIKGFS